MSRLGKSFIESFVKPLSKANWAQSIVMNHLETTNQFLGANTQELENKAPATTIHGVMAR
ncbi:MAG: hypothetical protein CMQ84_00425 [Gammaproteobacteria bacterium]|nr:hypothetical protein [Gammaproteobacteria bacterium]